MPELLGYHNPTNPLDRKAAKEAPHAYAMRQQPAGKNPGTGGRMNMGGKRRPGSRSVR